MRLHLAFPFFALCALLCSCRAGGDYALGVRGPATPSDVQFDHSHARWSTLLAKHVHGDGVDYAGFRADQVEFDAYLAGLQRVQQEDLDAWSREERFAFWINVYNAYTVRLIVQNYPLCSIKDLSSKPFCEVFDKAIVPLRALHPNALQRNLSLNDVEHEILRPRFSDARVHAAINCASKSCPQLLDEAFVAERLEDQLDGVMRRFVNDRRRNHLDRRAKTLRLSKIFRWFESDFAGQDGSVQAFVARFADPVSAGGDTAWIPAARISIKYYSWDLNDARRR